MYLIPAEEKQIEITIINSRFIASAGPAFSVEQARTFIQKVKKNLPGANHYVVAYIIGNQNSQITHCNDDGEPSGTAGRPALAVLSGSGFSDIIVVITRYFGGTKLGTGGLVRAYSDSVREVLLVLPKAEKMPTYTTKFFINYSIFEKSKQLIKENNGQIIDVDYGEEITLTVQLPIIYMDGFKRGMGEVTNGKTKLEILGEDLNTIFPLSS